MSFFLYILQSDIDKGLYVGISADVRKRLKAHNSGSTRSTKSRKPFRLIYTEEFSDRKAARRREKYLKSYSGATAKKEILRHCGIV